VGVSPQSNGMAEAFLKAFKRDYAYVYDRPDAQTVLSQLSAWFERLQRDPSAQGAANEVTQ
jgi:transposase InsO family protein